MTGQLEALRTYLAAVCSTITGESILAEAFDCPAEGAAIRCAAPLRLGQDAGVLAQKLQKALPFPPFFGADPIRRVSHSGGHLLFDLTKELYDALLISALAVYPQVQPSGPPCQCEDAAHARIAYTAHRMWMLARKADCTPCCPENRAVEHALLLLLAVPERFHHPRGLRLRLLAASDALLSMTRSVLPRLRPGLCKNSGHVAELACRILSHGLILLYGDTALPPRQEEQQ